MKCFSAWSVVVAALLSSSLAFATDDGNFQIAVATGLPVTDTILNLSNSGVSAGLPIPGLTGGPDFGVTPPAGGVLGNLIFTASGNICANVYVFSFDEQEVACCTCPMSPNSLKHYSTISDLVANPLTGTPYPHAGAVIKVVATVNLGTCNAALANVTPLAPGLVVWQRLGISNDIPAVPATLSSKELNRVANLCLNIQQNGSGNGICKTCSTDGL